MSYYKNSIEYHQDLDAFEARMRAEEAEAEYAKLVKVENTYGKNWEQDADNLRHVLESGNEMIENEENVRWVGQELDTNFVENWDFTPFPRNMPNIDFGTIDEIPF